MIQERANVRGLLGQGVTGSQIREEIGAGCADRPVMALEANRKEDGLLREVLTRHRPGAVQDGVKD